MTRSEFKHILENKILLLDGAVGTYLMRKGLSAGKAPEEFNLENPQIVRNAHQAYIQAGADIILTNTFGGSAIKLGEFNLADKTEEINRRAAEIALKTADGKVLVGGSIGPSGKYLPPIGSLEFPEALSAFRTQAQALTKAGVDLIVVETMSDIRELRACLIGIREVFSGPLIAHMTFSDGFNTITGTDPETAAAVMEALDVDAVGVNCSTGPEEIEDVVRVMAQSTHLPISVEPNAGMPTIRDGETCYPASPEEMARYSLIFADLGANIIGGCCGTGPEHIRANYEALHNRQPIPRNIIPGSRVCSRDQTIVIDDSLSTVIIGERINPSGRKKFAAEITARNFSAVRAEADKQVKAGARIIDINMGLPGEDEPALMRRAVRVVQAAVNIPLSLDSANPDALEAGLQEIEGKPIINSVNAEDDKLNRIIPLAKKYGAALIGLPLDEKGIPSTPEGRLKLGEKIVMRAMEAGIPKEDIFLDGLTLAVSADSQAPEVTLKTIRLFREKLGVKTVLGVSNVSFGLPNRADINAAFLAMALNAGLNLPIVNPYSPAIQNAVLTSDLLNGRDPQAKRYLTEAGEKVVAVKTAPERAEKPLEAQLYDAVLFGNREDVVALTHRLLKREVEPMKINDDILIPAMLEVGERYNRKRFFLPQVIMAAESMHSAFSVLKPHLRAEGDRDKGTVILATVKGDVHDIGKNIVAALVENHGFRVVDLGKNINAVEIINRAESEKADIIGLSALMTTTMEVMREMVAEIKDSIDVKVVVGGAVVTRKFAEEIGADGYGKDAAEAVQEIMKLLKE